MASIAYYICVVDTMNSMLSSFSYHVDATLIQHACRDCQFPRTAPPRRHGAACIAARTLHGSAPLRRYSDGKAHLGIPIAPALAEAIEGMPTDRDPFLVTAQAQPFISAGIGNWFRKRCDEAGLHHCSMHGLRKAAARRLAEAGCTDRQIMSITGYKTAQEVGRYTR